MASWKKNEKDGFKAEGGTEKKEWRWLEKEEDKARDRELFDRMGRMDRRN